MIVHNYMQKFYFVHHLNHKIIKLQCFKCIMLLECNSLIILYFTLWTKSKRIILHIRSICIYVPFATLYDPVNKTCSIDIT